MQASADGPDGGPTQTATVEAPVHVLIVEDDPSVRRAVCLALEDLGRVREAASRCAALEAVAQDRPDVVVLDVMLGGRSGLAVLAQWRAAPATADLPVVLLTGLDDVMERRAGTAAGADAYVTKPFETEHLLAVVQDLVDGGTRAKRGLLGRSPPREPVLPR